MFSYQTPSLKGPLTSTECLMLSLNKAQVQPAEGYNHSTPWYFNTTISALFNVTTRISALYLLQKFCHGSLLRSLSASCRKSLCWIVLEELVFSLWRTQSSSFPVMSKRPQIMKCSFFFQKLRVLNMQSNWNGDLLHRIGLILVTFSLSWSSSVSIFYHYYFHVSYSKYFINRSSRLYK